MSDIECEKNNIINIKEKIPSLFLKKSRENYKIINGSHIKVNPFSSYSENKLIIVKVV